MSYLASWYWDKGNYREKNEDSFSLQRVCRKGFFGKKEEAALMAVCDGIGGLPEGETASGFVTQRMTQWFYREGIRLMEGLFWQKRAAEGATDALAQIQDRMERYERAEGICCGTTCTIALIKGKRFVLLHVGDSRAYLVGKKERCLTTDHQKGGALCRCVGAFEFQFPDVRTGWIKRGEMLFLCTDGFFRLAPDGFFKGSLFSEKEEKNVLYRRLKGMGSFLRAQGEKDNQTAVLLLYTGKKVTG